MMRNTIIVALLAVSFVVVAGCSSEEECDGAECGSFDPAPTSNHPPLSLCADQCDAVSACDLMDVETCVYACRHNVFTREEMACLATTACESGVLVDCHDFDPPDGHHRY